MDTWLHTEQFSVSKENPAAILTAYHVGRSKELPYNTCRPALLIIPGGGYEMCSAREEEPVALCFLAAGYAVFVLEYSVKGAARHPAQLIEISTAMKLIKDRATDFGVDPSRVFVMGFSAGAHLAGMLATMWNHPAVAEKVPMQYGYNKPYGVILSYPVALSDTHAHRGSFCSLLGPEKAEDPAALEAVSLEKQVSADTAPVFIWHTVTDGCVAVQNSLVLAKALADSKVPFELHVYPEGPHGMSICNEVVDMPGHVAEKWVGEAMRWMKQL